MANTNQAVMLFVMGCLGACAVSGDPPVGAAEDATQVTQDEARVLLERFQRDAPATFGHVFGRPVLEALLAEGTSPTLWILFGLDPLEQRERLVLSAAESSEAFDFGVGYPPSFAPSEGVAPTGHVAPSGSGVVLPGDAKGALDLTEATLAQTGKRISHALARTLTASYRAASGEERAGVRLARAELRRLLADPRVHGVWFLSARDAMGSRGVVLVPADATGKLLPLQSRTIAATAGWGSLANSPCLRDDCPSW